MDQEEWLAGRMANEPKKAIEGTGLGLSIANGNMQLYGGRVKIESIRGLLQMAMASANETQRHLINLTA